MLFIINQCYSIIRSIGCSGLAVISKFNFKEVEFNAYTDRGNFSNWRIDGEYFSGKGAGRVQIWPLPNLKVRQSLYFN